MKNKLVIILLAVIAMLIFATNVFGQIIMTEEEKILGNPEKYPFYIGGTNHIHNRTSDQSFELKDIDSKNIKVNIKDEDSIPGYLSDSKGHSKINGEFVTFAFNNVEYPETMDLSSMKAWLWDGNYWNQDSEIETETGLAGKSTLKSIVAVLVLDCSSSIQPNDFESLKENAKSFITTIYDTYVEKKEENNRKRKEAGLGIDENEDNGIYLGVVGFNTMERTNKMIKPVRLLDGKDDGSGNYTGTVGDSIEFIDNLERNNGTAIFHGMKKGIDIIKNADLPDIEDAYLVTFTDGADVSSNPEKEPGVGGKKTQNVKDHGYFKYVKKELEKTHNDINNKKISSFIVAVKDPDKSKTRTFLNFMSVFKKLVSGKGSYKLANNFDEVKPEFEKIANTLSDLKISQTLNCTISTPPHAQKIMWTFGKPYIPSSPPNKPKWVKASDNYKDKIVVEWGYVEGADEYKLYRTKNKDGSNTELLTITTKRSYTDKPLPEDTYYYYGVAAVNIKGDSSSVFDKGMTILSLPDSPKWVMATDEEYSDKIEVTWKKVVKADKYILYRADNQKFNDAEILSTTNLLYFVDENLPRGIEYYYGVVSVNKTGESEKLTWDIGSTIPPKKIEGGFLTLGFTPAFYVIPSSDPEYDSGTTAGMYADIGYRITPYFSIGGEMGINFSPYNFVYYISSTNTWYIDSLNAFMLAPFIQISPFSKLFKDTYLVETYILLGAYLGFGLYDVDVGTIFRGGVNAGFDKFGVNFSLGGVIGKYTRSFQISIGIYIGL